jgi:hypothetical protein
VLSRTAREIPWDILWARRGEDVVGLEIAGDQLECVGAPDVPPHESAGCS